MKAPLLFLFGLIFTTLSSQTIYISENFDNLTLPVGWSNIASSGSQTWTIDTIRSGGFDSTALAFFDDDILGASSINNKAILTTPSFDNSGDSLSYLEFDYNFRQFNGIADSFLVEVYDGSNWQRVLSIGTDDCGSWTAPNCIGNFPHAHIDISAYANANCQVRFIYEDGNDWGWYVGIDNVEVWSRSQFDLAVVEILRTGSFNCSQTDSIEIKMVNEGIKAVTTYDLAYILNGGTPIIEPISNRINPLDTLQYTFALPATFLIDTNSIAAYVSLTNDINRDNDTLSQIKIVSQEFPLSYFEGFEGISSWSISGNNSSWEIGVPNGTLIDTAKDGQNALVTNLNGNHSNAELSYVSSPCIRLADSVESIRVTFDLIHDLERFDFVWLEYSIDNGAKWQKVDTSILSVNLNWYNDPRRVWTGLQSRWTQSSTTIEQLTNVTYIRFRFVFQSDFSGAEEGVGIDNFFVNEVATKDISLKRVPILELDNQCGLGKIDLPLEFENFGTDSISFVKFFYQLDNQAIVEDSLSIAIPPGSTNSFVFSQAVNLNGVSTPSIKVWTTLTGDTNQLNDTLSYRFQNNQNRLPLIFKEDFEGFGITPTLNFGNRWTNTYANSGYAWTIDNSSPRQSSGPNKTASRRNFAYLETMNFNNSSTPNLSTTCLDLGLSSSPRLNFYYHKYGSSMGDLLVDVYDGIWNNGVLVIPGPTQTNANDPWLYASVDLSAFKGKGVRIRFRPRIVGSFGLFSNMAIDDIVLVDTDSIPLEITNFKIDSSSCTEAGLAKLKFDIKKYQTGPISANDLSYEAYLNGVLVFTENQITNIPDSVISTPVELVQSIPINQFGKFEIEVRTLYSKNSQISISSASDSVLNKINTLPYFHGFENNILDFDCPDRNKASSNILESNGWAVSPDTLNDWVVTNVNDCDTTSISATYSPFSGPPSPQEGSAFAFWHDASSDSSHLYSPCFDLNASTFVQLEFWYHRYYRGPSFRLKYGSFSVDVRNGNQWQTIFRDDSVTLSNTNINWKLASLDITPYIGSDVQFRFRNSQSFNENDKVFTSIDGFKVYEPLSSSLQTLQAQNQTLAVYPNPNNGQFNIKVPKNLIGERYKIMDLSGKVIRSGRFNSSLEQFAIDQDQGIYLIRVVERGIREKVVVY
jgi:hypothetical protein